MTITELRASEVEERRRAPLSGINVIDFGHYYAGPMAGMILADQGANVIRVARPGRMESTSAQYRLLNRNKSVLELDVKTEDGRKSARSLIERADILIENFRPGVMNRLELGYSDVRTSNPGLVYLSLPGFASTDRERSHLQAWEGVLAAATGMYTELSLFRQNLGFPPNYTPIPQCSAYGAFHGVIAVMAALVARERHGFGTVIETPLVDAGLSGFSCSFVVDRSGSFRKADADALGPAGQKKAAVRNVAPTDLEHLAFISGDLPAAQLDRFESASLRMGDHGPLGSFYACRDGRKVLIYIVDSAHFVTRCLTVLGVYGELLREGFVNEGPWVRGLSNNMSCFADLSASNSQRLREVIADALRTRPAAEWEVALGGVVPITTVRTKREWLMLEPMHQSGVLARMTDGGSTLTVPGRVSDLSGPEGNAPPCFREPERIDWEQADRLFMRKGSAKVAEGDWPLQKKGDLLRGLQVLDMSNMVAGPTSSYTLAQYGANFTKLDSSLMGPHPAVFKALQEINQGKQSVLVDMRTAPGREIFRRLVAQADVVHHNILDETAKRLGVDHAQLQAINPGVISCQLSCFGGPFRGAWENRPGFEPIAQCFSGLMASYGTLERPQWHGSTPAADIMSGLCLAFATVLAVYQRETTGHAGEARTSLARAVSYYQLPYMILEDEQDDWDTSRGHLATGRCWWDRMYQCSDDWIYVSALRSMSGALAEVTCGFAHPSEEQVEASFLTRGYSEWLARLAAVGIAAHKVMTIGDICNDGARNVNNDPADEVITGRCEMLCWENHPCGAPVLFTAPTWVRVGESRSYRRLSPAPRLGQHTAEVLQAIGYSEQEVAELVRIKVAHEYFSALGGREKFFSA